MTVSIEEIKHLAKLSKIALTPEQEEHYRKDIDTILRFLDTLQVPETSGNTNQKPGINLFIQEESYSEPETLLGNSKHQGQHGMIEIKTSLTH